MTQLARKKTGGRPTKCTPELTQRFAELMRQGNYLSTVADLCGISRRSAYRWIERGEEALVEAYATGDEIPAVEKPYVNFRLEVRRAAAEAVKEAVEIIWKAAEADTPGDWRAARWWLEKRCQDTWGAKKRRLEHTGAGGGPIRQGPSGDGLQIEIVREGGDNDGPE